MAHHADETIGDRIRLLRNDRGLTQEQLAELAGVSTDLVKKLEQNRRQSARLTSLTALAEALDVPRSQMLDKRPRLGGGESRICWTSRRRRARRGATATPRSRSNGRRTSRPCGFATRFLVER
jgi:transcriptional regulator with XRE-family HTH domain